jgi:hypothetical protein
MRRTVLLAALIVLAAAPGAHPGPLARMRCDVRTPAGPAIDCFSGAYHGTGFLPMEETISFRQVTTAALRADPLWRLWLADSRRERTEPPCPNRNAVAYTGSFSFYGGGSFIACSRSTPNLLNGYFRVRRTYRYVDGGTAATLTRGVFSASAARDDVVELVFSDATRRHYAQPEVVLGRPAP